jgi:hypothetical protein
LLAALTRPVDRVEPLGHKTLEPELSARGHELRPVGDDRQHRAPRRTGEPQALDSVRRSRYGTRVTVSPSR